MVTPEPDMLFVLGFGMRGGPRSAAFTVLRIADAAYLVYLGIQLIGTAGTVGTTSW
jgi:threonine/homoserine/homoserine lactone efflux protein